MCTLLTLYKDGHGGKNFSPNIFAWNAIVFEKISKTIIFDIVRVNWCLQTVKTHLGFSTFSCDYNDPFVLKGTGHYL